MVGYVKLLDLYPGQLGKTLLLIVVFRIKRKNIQLNIELEKIIACRDSDRLDLTLFAEYKHINLASKSFLLPIIAYLMAD